MRLIADVHGATAALRRLAASSEPILILGDLINFIDYRSGEGMVSDIAGPDFAAQLIHFRTHAQPGQARALWHEFIAGRERDVRQQFDAAVERAYVEICGALVGATAYVTYGNVDRPDLLADRLPAGSRFVDGEVVEIDGRLVGFAGGGVRALDVPGEVSDDDMREKLARLGRVDILCTHVPPAVPALSIDVVGGRVKGSEPILEYIRDFQPGHHYFGDIHQPQAISWRVGDTICHNVGYFRATGQAVTHRS